MNEMSEIEYLSHQAWTQAASIAQDVEMERLYAARELSRPFYLIRPKILPDGDQWCALYGDNLQEGVCAFGDTPSQASIQFDIEWLNGWTSKGKRP